MYKLDMQDTQRKKLMSLPKYMMVPWGPKCLLLSQSISVQFSAPTSGRSQFPSVQFSVSTSGRLQSPITSAPEDLMSSSGLPGCTHTDMSKKYK